jgi:hypothetical protein
MHNLGALNTYSLCSWVSLTPTNLVVIGKYNIFEMFPNAGDIEMRGERTLLMPQVMAEGCITCLSLVSLF